MKFKPILSIFKIDNENYKTIIPNEKGMILFDSNSFISSLNLVESIWKVVDENNLEYDVIFPKIDNLQETEFDLILQGNIYTDFILHDNLQAHMFVTGSNYQCDACILKMFS